MTLAITPHGVQQNLIPGPVNLVTALPTAPVDRQEVFYLADSTNGIIWHFRYRSASGSSFKWEFVGGSPLTAQIATQEGLSANSGAFVDAVTNVGPTVTVPLGGDYVVDFHATLLHNTASVVGAVGVKPGSGTVTFPAEVNFGTVVNLNNTHGRSGQLYTGLAASSAMKVQYRSPSGAMQVLNRTIAVRPVRVG